MLWPMSYEKERPKKGPSGSPKATEIFLSLPGLNLHQQAMGPLERILQSKGHRLLRYQKAYFQHSGPFPKPEKLLEEWLLELDRLYLKATQNAKEVSLLGVSLGALLAVWWSLSRKKRFKRLLLVAPALRIRLFWRILFPFLGKILPQDFCFPSLGSSFYAQSKKTPLAAYQAVLLLESLLWKATKASFLDQSSLFLAARKGDPLVFAPIQKEFSHAFLHPLPFGFRGGGHLGVDSFTLGEKVFLELEQACFSWLSRTQNPIQS